ncbi:hypothetical protein FHP29_20865 [Nocardioides albidus]|uniref:Uncharacterized protein n=1 Tax=Nocardioides albidus TaxID=1517589 RepID=A0A5C4VLF2_9ACTN|nr:hypothetical protein [Nocardioides albidus]TNM36581.1 hypothetical protein FHP29_20865 [Nocardioides albidus]
MTVSADDLIAVTAWTDLDELGEEMDELAGQIGTLTSYARRWVCQRAGFEPSPLCLLRPLAEVMDLVADGLGALESLALDDWADLRLGVARTARDLRLLDEDVAARMPVVA